MPKPPTVGEKVLMNNGLVAEVVKVRWTQFDEHILYDVQSGEQKWRMPADCFVFPIPENVTPMFHETTTKRMEREAKFRGAMQALAQRLKRGYDED